MGHWTRVLSAAVGVAVAAAAPRSALAQQAAGRAGSIDSPELRAVAAIPGGAIDGIVSDERGHPLPGAMVTVLGATMAMTLADAHGRFSLDKLPAGEYTLRAHLTGFAASRRENVRVGAMASSTHRVQLRRLDIAVATTGGTPEPLAARPIIAAGFGLPQVDAADAPDTVPDDHSHSETAWRLRHLARSILKDSAGAVVAAEDHPETSSASILGRTKDSGASMAASLFGDLPFTGEVNLLTTGAFAPGDLFSGRGMPRGVAYLAIGAPTSAGDWVLRAAMSGGDLPSWIVAGSFLSRRSSMHSYDLGLSYSTQAYHGGTPVARAALTDGSRNVGELYALDRWTPGPGVSFEYGGRYARYDYLEHPGLFSPRAGITLEPAKGTRVTGLLAQRMVAPGAEEFLSPGIGGPWLPPERTFSPFAGDVLRVERARGLDVLLEHDFTGYAVGVRRFFQGVDNQLMTVFGIQMPAHTRSVGHYYVASAGSVDAQGWGVRLRTLASKRLSGSIDYSLTHSRWNSRGDVALFTSLTTARTARPWLKNIHDITTSIRTDIPETATRVFVLYKINSAYSRPSADLSDAGFDGRFDVQVNQALPFGVGGTKWEVLVGVRNLFRDPNDPASVYDELLVVRPPKRVVGGFLVRF